MVNQNIQGVIPINGRGFTAKIKGDYQAGEYSKLSNMRIHEGILQTRYNVNHYINEGAVAEPVYSAHPFVGFIGESVIVVNLTNQWEYKKGSKTAMWSPSSLPKDANPSSWHKIVGVFEYNKVWHWITWQWNQTTSTSSIHLYSTPNDGILSDTTFAMLTTVTLFTSTTSGFVFDNFFIYKERLWVCTNQGLYFSKSTDPKIFAVPDGGFFKLRDQNITYAFGHKDNIFILCDTSMHALNYGADPNTDSYLREISNVMGADHGTSHGDTAYVINGDGLYAVSPNSIELVKSDFEIGISTPWNKLVSWEDYLIVVKYYVHNYTGFGSPWPGVFKNVGRVVWQTPWELESLTDSNVWFIDMTTGACHTLDFNDQFTGTGLLRQERGHVTDIIVNPNKDFNRNSSLTLMTNKYDGTANAPGFAHVYYMDKNEDDFFILDRVVNNPADNIVRKMKPNIQVEFRGYTPDGNEYLMKKFRNLQLMGNFAYWDFEVLFAYDNQDYNSTNLVWFTADLPGIEAAGTKRSPYPGRIPLNQRARSISILLRTKDPRVPMVTSGYNIYERVEFTDLRVLWTYTGRGPTHLTQSPTT